MIVPHAGLPDAAKWQVIHADLNQRFVDAQRAGMGIVRNMLLQVAVIRKEIQG